MQKILFYFSDKFKIVNSVWIKVFLLLKNLTGDTEILGEQKIEAQKKILSKKLRLILGVSHLMDHIFNLDFFKNLWYSVNIEVLLNIS
eukprot:snap_masked-scaffold_4-processed-gene-10.12-mRNA-1 protein AED:1.00 eAED:1.00 QI:0/0/0/0/1/1/3/0/87